MIKVEKHPVSPQSYPFSLGQLSPKEIAQLATFEEWGIMVKAYSNSIFDNFTKNLILYLYDNFNVYFIYIETFPQLKSKIRSHKKMFYAHNGAIKKSNLYEVEIDLEDNKSILSAIVKIDKYNFEYCLSHINSNFAFCLAVEKSKRSFPVNRYDFLKRLIGQRNKEDKLTKVNFLKVLIQTINDSRLIFTIKSTGNDEESISLFAKNTQKIEHGIREIIRQNKSPIEN